MENGAKKVYVITDMEGVAGINGWHECRPAPDGSDADFERSRRLLTDEVAAAVLGAGDGGAGDVLVLDGHRSGDNFIAERLPEGARYVMGRKRPNPLDGLDGTFDGVVLLGYHSMAGTPNGLLAHTMSSGTWKRFSVNGITLGEIGMMALIAGSHGVPVWLVTGGRLACDEATALLGPDARTLAVKEDVAHESSITMAPAAARRMIRKTVAEVVAVPPPVRPFVIEPPWKASLELTSREVADAQTIPSSLRTDDVTFSASIESIDALLPRYWAAAGRPRRSERPDG